MDQGTSLHNIFRIYSTDLVEHLSARWPLGMYELHWNKTTHAEG